MHGEPGSTVDTTMQTNKKREEAFVVKTGLAKMLKGGVIMDVVNVEQV
jgi:pyridoxal biosynthesis lyase PdxS